jgi:signal transduction histidine kinase/DNA-binding response OmpR family regulator
MKRNFLTVAVHYEQDVVVARQRARQIAGLLGFEDQDQTRIATAVSEIARNAYCYAGGGKVEFSVEGESSPQLLIVRVIDEGPGIADVEKVLSGQYRSTTGMGLGILGAHRLMDQVDIRSAARRGTEVVLKKFVPPRAPFVTPARMAHISRELTGTPPAGPLGELQEQNQELLRTLSELRERQDDLLRLNRELEDTNRGVVALYAELDEKADHLRRADEMKSRFLSNMSHEFRTPLNSIRALSRLLLDCTDGDLSAEQRKQVKFISKAADDLTALVDDLLDLAKIEAGKTEVRPIEFSVANLFSALRGMLRPLLLSEDVKLIFEEPDPALQLYTDEGKVSQILRNFISNAIKFTERGEVRVGAKLSDDLRMVSISVADTGIGISPEDQSRIFDEFTQVANPLQHRVKGTGLGLPLCRRLVRLLGGEITLSSEPGVGSVFTAVLPVHYEDLTAEPGTTAPEMEIDVGLIPVLVVEDEPQTRLIYEKFLRGSRYQPVAARNLREARQLLQRVSPRAIVLDILLKGEDSWHYLGELKRDPSTAALPVLVATTVDDERKGLALGADAYCVKPLERATLLEKLDRLVDRPVLVIDDDPASRYLLQKLLSGRHACVIEAIDGHSGLLAARRAKPALIFLDLQLPDADGEEILRELKKDADLREVPVALVTSRLLTPEERARLTESANTVLEKSELSAETTRGILAANGL